MNKPIIADTSALISLASVTDSNHSLALTTSAQIQKTKRSLIIPADVFTETINTIGKKIDHAQAVAVGEQLLSSTDLIIEEASPALRQLAFNRFSQQPGSVSFTDCLVMAYADHYQTTEIFGFDEAFRKNGFIRLGLD